MSFIPPPLPPNPPDQPSPDANIRDVRKAFARRKPPSATEAAEVRIFIEGKIELVRREPHLTEHEKAAAVLRLESQIPDAEKKP